MATFQLRFPLSEIPRWAAACSYPQSDDEPIRLGALAKQQGYLTREQFLTIARWKSARPAKRHQRNDESTVQEVTRFAFGTSVETLRISALTLLSGVSIRTASAILHLCHRDAYPLMDFRAVWSLGIDGDVSDWLALWPQYAEACRRLAAEARTDMRTLDRALWGYSAVMQST